jgi:hypothetical protein
MGFRGTRILRGALLSVHVLLASSARADTHTLSLISTQPFRSDGCTLFPQGDFLACCVEHDYNYWRAHSWAELLKADSRLFGCVWHRRRAMDKPAAALMWVGAKFGWLTRWRPLGTIR